MSIGVLRLLLPRSIRGRLVLGIALVHAVLMTLFITDLIHRQQQFMQNENRDRAIGLAQMVAVNSDSLLLTNDVRGMDELLVSVKNDPLVIRAMVVGPQGLVLGHTDAKNIGHWVVDDISRGLLSGPAQARQIFADSSVLEAAAPVTVNGRVIGWARVAIDRSEQTTEMRGTLLEGLFYTVAAIFVGTMFALWIAKRLTADLVNLGGQAERLRKGDRHLSAIANPPIEIAQLESIFRNMANAILNRQDELLSITSRLEIEIAENKRAEENLRITASVFDISQEAIIITDADNTIIDVNLAFTTITGYSREEVRGKNPKLLSSGRQDKGFYASMWQSLKEQGAWRGEIWNRRKSGEIYAEMLSIAVLRDEQGKTLRHIGVFSDISHIKAHEAELSHVAHFDALTGIPNRLLLADRMKQAIAQTAREQKVLAVCYLDLDGFKPINDIMGHETGDQVLIEVAKRIENTIRGGDTVARLGGDEFVVLLQGQEKGEESVTILERLLMAIAQPISVKETYCSLSASIGVSIYPLDNEDPDTLLRHADQAMYEAKQSGKNRFHIYDAELDQRARIHHAFMGDIRNALKKNEFVLYYQPKVDMRTKQLVGAEALIRWQHPEKGMLPPSEFIRAIGNTDLDIEIGDWVISTALTQIKQWRLAGINIEVSVNISAFHLESVDFVEKLRQKIAQHPDIPARRLQIEVLETAALDDVVYVGSIIEACREFGVGFALDDFGTGYSSLTYLSHLPVDALKIDQSFVRDMLVDKGDMAIVQGIIALARAFERQTVAEGIETKDQYEVLLDMGCEIAQGYFVARPMPANELSDWHAKSNES